MIPSPLRRAVLVLAVVAFLISRASAQNSDASFAASLDQGAPIFAQLKQVKKTPQKPPEPVEDSTGDPKGDHTTQAISVLGMLNEEEQFEAMGAMIIFLDSKLDPKDGNWHIEQWMFQTDIYGEVGEIAHGMIIKTPDGKTVGTTRATVDPADPKTKAQYDAMLKHWAESAPKGAGK